MPYKLSKLKLNPKNPKRVKAARLNALRLSLLSFPQMLPMRPIIIDKDGVVIDGNHRIKAIRKIVEDGQEALRQSELDEKAFDFWSKVIESGELPDSCVFVHDGTEKTHAKLIALTNISAGQLDVNAFAKNYEFVEDILKPWDVEWARFSRFFLDFSDETTEIEEVEYHDIQIQAGDVFKIGESHLIFFIMGAPKELVYACAHPSFVDFFYHYFGLRLNEGTNKTSSVDIVAAFNKEKKMRHFGVLRVNNFIRAQSMRQHKTRWHDHQKPAKLFKFFLENFTQPGESVLDLFAGSGGMLVACESMGRRCVCVEVEPHNCAKIIKRAQISLNKNAEKTNL